MPLGKRTCLNQLRSRMIGHAVRCAFEHLEHRVLLSTITWTNRLVSDNFGIYGANAGVARAIVDRAIDDWERVITNFNGFAGRNTYSLDVSAGNLGGGTRGSTGGITYDLLLKPSSADITMDDNGGGSGWYFDPVIGTAAVPDDGEFTTINTPFQANAAVAGFDFYRTILHEIGHAMGLSSSSALLQAIDIDIGDDPNDGGTARLFTIDVDGNPGADYTYTNAGGFHLYEGPSVGGNPIHPNDLMNSGRTGVAGRRQLITDTIASLLRDAYGYTVTLPRFINTFYANLNTTTNVLTINGDINPTGSNNDVIDLEVDGTAMSFEVNGSDEVIEGAQFSTIVVNAGAGNDDIDVDHLLASKTVTINAGSGNDSVDVALEDDDIDTFILSNFTFNGDSGTDSLVFHDTADGPGADTYTITSSTAAKSTRVVSYSGVESIVINGSNQPSSYALNSLLSTTDLSISSGSANDTFTVATGDFDTIDGNIAITGNGGIDTVTIDDIADTGNDTYQVSGNRFEKTVGGLGSVVLFNTTENLIVNASNGNNTFNIPQMSPWINLTINAGTGADTFNVAFGTLDIDSNILGRLTFNGGAGADTLNFLDTSDGVGSDTYTLNSSSLDKPALANPITFTSMSSILLTASNNADTISVTGFGGAVTVRGNGGNDVIDVDTDIIVLGTSCVVDTGSGADILRINADATGATSARIANSQTLSELLVGAGGLLTVDAGADKVLRVNDLVTLGGSINLNDNFFIREAGAGIPSLPAYTNWLTNGYNGGDWLGAQPSIYSLPADATNFSLGYARASAIFGGGGGVFAGQAVSADAIVARFTRYGDANLDGIVNLQDFNRVAANFGATGAVWSQGNFNYDNVVNLQDFNKLAANFGASAGPDMLGQGASSTQELRRLLDDVTGGADVVSKAALAQQSIWFSDEQILPLSA